MTRGQADPCLYERADVKRLSHFQLHSLMSIMLESAAHWALGTNLHPHGRASRAVRESIEWWQRGEAARCRDEIEWRMNAGKRGPK